MRKEWTSYFLLKGGGYQRIRSKDETIKKIILDWEKDHGKELPTELVMVEGEIQNLLKYKNTLYIWKKEKVYST